jgi:Sulfatase
MSDLGTPALLAIFVGAALATWVAGVNLAKATDLLARQMEVYAGFLEYADHHVGRLIDALQDLGVLDDTLVYYIIGDNGASAEGSLQGALNEVVLAESPGLETPEYLAANIDKLGGPEGYNHYAVGWGHAVDTPYQWTKQVASHWGGTRNPAIVHWPRGIQAKDELRSQFHHVIDVAPTVLEAAGLPEPTAVNGITQEPLHGVSMAYSFDDPGAAERRETQYFELFGNRGIYHQGWSAVTRHTIPWEQHGQRPPFDADTWELYDGTRDWTQAHDLTAEQPERLAELQRLFLIEATKFNVLPLDDRFVERLNPDLAGRPQLIQGDSQVLFPGMGSLNEDAILSIKNKSHAITAELVVADEHARGVIINQGGITGGWVLYLTDGRPSYHYSFLGLEHATITADQPLTAGTHQLRMEFAYDGGGLGKGGTATLYVDGDQVASGRMERTHAFIYTMDETTDVGRDTGAPVCDDYAAGDNAFTGQINWVRIDLGTDSHDHLLDPAQLLHLAMTRQ